MSKSVNILGAGIYTAKDAARLIGTTPAAIRHWLLGGADRQPLWRPHYADLTDGREISFGDLMELRVVVALRAAGLSLQSIRFAITLAQEKFGLERPLSTRSFKTDGREILLTVAGDEGLVSLSRRSAGQHVYREVVAQSLLDVEFESDHVARWLPRTARSIVIDPGRLFGEPVLDRYGIATRTIYEDFLAYGDAKHISAIYEIPVSAVRGGINFERGLDGQSPL